MNNSSRVLIAALIAFVLIATTGASASAAFGGSVGDTLKTIRLVTLDGKREFDTSDIAAKSLFVFVNSVCGMCQKELTDITTAPGLLSGVDLYLIVVDNERERALTSYTKFLGKATLLHDPEFQLGYLVDIYSTPSTLLVGADRTILFKASSYKPEVIQELKAALGK